MTKEKKFKWKWWHVLIALWFFTGLIEINISIIWQYIGNIQTLLLYNGLIQTGESAIVLFGKVMTNLEN